MALYVLSAVWLHGVMLSKTQEQLYLYHVTFCNWCIIFKQTNQQTNKCGKCAEDYIDYTSVSFILTVY
jgi:hypothetical protein